MKLTQNIQTITPSISKSPYRNAGRIKQIDEKHYNENYRGQNVPN